ncbi:hypothetical protein FLL66_18110 [Vibrio cholerae]|nr:hypothetical protein FLL66_18110 [Vibrio cholerae]
MGVGFVRTAEKIIWTIITLQLDQYRDLLSNGQQKSHNKRLKRDCQRVAFPVPLSRGGYGCCV